MVKASPNVKTSREAAATKLKPGAEAPGWRHNNDLSRVSGDPYFFPLGIPAHFSSSPSVDA